VAGNHESDKLDIASTTKILTAYIVCQLAEIDPKVLDQVVTFSAAADKTGGSTAGVREGEQVSVGELLYGLLLPSGNDAAHAFAEHFSPHFALAAEQSAGGNADPKKPDPGKNLSSTTDGFVAEMNRQAARLGMQETRYINPHGLTAKDHKSSAKDQFKLASAALKNELFRKYIATRQRGAQLTGQGGYQRNVIWKNTNHLLAIEGYSGVKTGTTDAAGACLVSLGGRDGRELIVVVLGAASPDARYVDARNLFRWAWQTAAK
jgi:D-alanyl-D-alanine carboxypeptidase (penicillin-binding protein 5/6)